MIKVNVERDRELNRITAFTISGHANAGPHGYDIVCAAVSALSIGAVNAVAALCNVQLPVQSGKKGGYLRCEIPNDLTATIDHDVQLLIEGMVVALKDIEKEYSKHISVTDNKK